MQDRRRRELDAERLITVGVQDDVDDVLVEESSQFGPPGEFEDLVGFRLCALELFRLLGGDGFRSFDRSCWLARQRDDFGDLEARRLHDILQMARTEPAHGLTQPTKG